jgi:hypothetical protein
MIIIYKFGFHGFIQATPAESRRSKVKQAEPLSCNYHALSKIILS